MIDRVRLAPYVFLLVFLLGLGGFAWNLWQFCLVEDELVELWDTSDVLELELKKDGYRLWLFQDVEGTERDVSMEEYWRGGYLVRYRLNGKGRWYAMNELRGVTRWRGRQEKPLSVAMLNVRNAATVELKMEQFFDEDEAPEKDPLLAVARDSQPDGDTHLRWMMLWLAGGIVGGVLAAVVVGMPAQDEAVVERRRERRREKARKRSRERG